MEFKWLYIKQIKEKNEKTEVRFIHSNDELKKFENEIKPGDVWMMIKGDIVNYTIGESKTMELTPHQYRVWQREQLLKKEKKND